MKYDFYVFYDCVNKPIINGYPQEKAQFASWFIEKKSWMFRLSKGTGLSMENIHHHVLRFIYGTKNLRRRGQCWMQCKVLHSQKFVVACYLQVFLFWRVIWLKSLTFALCKHIIVTFCVEPCALL